MDSPEFIQTPVKRKNGMLIECLLIACVIYSLVMQLPEMRNFPFGKAILYLGWIILLALSAMNSRIVFNRTALGLFCLLLIYDAYSIFMAAFFTGGYLENKLFYSVNITLGTFLAGYLLSFHLNTHQLFRVSGIYAATVCILLPYIYYHHAISTDIYESKNSFGPIIVFSIILLAFADSGRNILLKTGKWILILFSIYVIAGMNSRASLVSISILALYSIVVTANSPKWKFYGVSAVILAVMYGFLSGSITECFSAIARFDRFNGDIDALSSGRITLITSQWSNLIAHPALGIGKGYVENFHYSALLQLGIAGAIPVYLLYAFPLFRFTFRRGIGNSDRLSKMVALMALHGGVISVFEELAPFGQGTAYFILWLFTGYAVGVGNPGMDTADVKSNSSSVHGTPNEAPLSSAEPYEEEAPSRKNICA